jgi:phenylalanine-4-hydroxylase
VNFPTDYIPQHIELSKTLWWKTGWSVIPVAAIIPAEEFLSLLSMRQFPWASFMRIPEELDYIEEPDIFHEFFGHIPLLAWQEYADFVWKFWEIGLRIDPSLHPYLLRIFWYTVEFGLIRRGDMIQAYGAGILSSYGELDRALRADLVSHRPFDIWGMYTNTVPIWQNAKTVFCNW